MEKIKANKIMFISLFLYFNFLTNTNCDLLVRSPNELKSQFISMSIK